MIGNYDFKIIEKDIRDFWRKINLLEKIQTQNKDKKSYFLLDGPPYANNVPHIGHIRNTVYKDLYIRHASGQGKSILFQPGFDTHGLPIENMVEKKLNLKSKKDIEVLGIKKFCDTCKANATHYKDVWLNVYDMMGSWYSWKTPYLTYDNNYLESVWWSFKKMWDKDMVYEGKKPVFWCPKCETALAGYEATDKYTNVEDPLIIVKFKVKKAENDYLLVFTTTPWTLPANVVVAAKGDEDYVKAKTNEGNLIIAKNLVKLFDELKLKYEIIEEFKGKKLDGLEYESVLDVPSQKELQNNKKALRVIMSIPILKERITSKVMMKKGLDKSGDIFEHFVSVEEGTGLVHCAPGHGKTDSLVGKHYDLPAISPLDDQCKFTKEVGKYAGIFVKEADKLILEDMQKDGKLLYSAKLTHSYPLCWRCSSPLIFRLSNQWFLKVDKIKEQMLEANEKVNWQPEYARERFTEWVANADDWNFSRQRFWGIPIPVWKSKQGEYKVIGSKEELEEATKKKLPEDFDLHTIKDITFKSNKGNEMKPVGDIFDVWFDSGSAPFAAFHYPFENKELFEKNYPVSRINESQDQIRGWFYSLMFCGISALDKSPYEIVSMPGWVVDKNGEKMSKSLGNFISAEDAITNLGADNVRFYYCWDVAPETLAKFNEEAVKTEVGRVHSMLWNLQKFLITQVTAAKALSSDYSLKNISELELKTEDKWLISKLNSTILKTIEGYDSFKLHKSGRAIYDFIITDLSRTYVQLIRDRIEDDDTPLSLIFHAITKIIKLMTPISPHITDSIYQNLIEINDIVPFYKFKESVHLELIPGYGEEKELKKQIDENLELEFGKALNIVGAILAARDKVQIGIRWPIKEVIIDTDKDNFAIAKRMEKVILDSANVKSLKQGKVPLDVSFKLRYKDIGKAFGEKTGDVAEAINKNKENIVKHIEKDSDDFKIEGFKLKKSYFEVSKNVGKEYSMGEFKEGLVFIKSVLDNEMEPEGFMREVSRRIQVLRKEMNLLKQDKIDLYISGDSDLIEKIKVFELAMKEKVGALNLIFGKEPKDEKYQKHEDKVKGKKFTLFALKK